MLSSGSRLRSQVCETEIIVVRPGPDGIDLTCGGHPLVALGEQPRTLEPLAGLATGAQLGKRYSDASGELEILVTKAGTGTLGNDKEPLVLKEAKPLPSSD
jgi:hypothetical protein